MRQCSSWLMLLIFLLVTPCQQWPTINLWSSFSTKYQHNSLSNTRDSRVLNFFPVPVEEECLSDDKRRRGTCMNTYACRINNGKSHGPCALGFGVCCIFTTSCGGEVGSNLTYVTNPDFPNLIDQPMNCSVVVKKIEPQVSQLRIDFLHFNIGQPNRKTGVCDEDMLEITSGDRTFQLCGWNSGQHIYLDVADGPVKLDFILPSALQSRMWEMSIIQLPFEQRAPAGCLQYFDATRGLLKTLNYLPNGRYLANQDYLLCVRQEKNMCSIAYTPCTNDSFRIGPMRYNNINQTNNINDDIESSGTGNNDDTTSMRRCNDRVLIPCDFEEFITPGNDGAGICDLEHCGNSLCGQNELDADGNCRVETSATPFHIRVAFGSGNNDSTSPENKAGMCLTYEQLPCS